MGAVQQLGLDVGDVLLQAPAELTDGHPVDARRPLLDSTRPYASSILNTAGRFSLGGDVICAPRSNDDDSGENEMNLAVTPIIDLVDQCLSQSPVLARIGYNSRKPEVIDSTNNIPARCCFHVATGNHRCLSICCHFIDDENLLFTFEIFHTMLDESFLLDDWARLLHDSDAPYPFLVSYSDDFGEKGEAWTGFASYL